MKLLLVPASLAVIYLLAWAVSSDRRGIRYRPLLVMLVTQIVLAFLLLNTSAGAWLIGGFAAGFEALLGFAGEGIEFVFGGMVNEGAFSFFVAVLLPIVFISALIGILQYIGVLPLLMRGIGWLLSWFNGMGRLESYNGIASLVLGQSEVFISLKKQLGRLPKQRLYTLCASAMSTVSMSIVGAYMQMIEPRFVVTALALNLFGGFMIASIINPYRVSADEDLLEVENPRNQAFFEMLGEYILDGFKVAVIVAAMLIGYVALIAMINGLCESLVGIDFQTLIGYLFAPLAILIGIPPAESVAGGSLIATKLLSNEFVAMLQLGQYTELGPRAVGIISVFLVSFANFSSIGIIVGAIKALNDPQGTEVARFGLKLLYGATLVSLLSGTVAGLFL
ncbi:NupC/NupG family nucleoside CNT transporter [Halotalea alkalilenta]|uniref:NupC/NupG family nucleoside CNT transporter n=1 Tax=Halotalea alkalilenta TaxID=376489 RepID=UPI000480572F|nr:nucleoside transporter C-terminal domain-containing protein [Halotalea alkalilenta]